MSPSTAFSSRETFSVPGAFPGSSDYTFPATTHDPTRSSPMTASDSGYGTPPAWNTASGDSIPPSADPKETDSGSPPPEWFEASDGWPPEPETTQPAPVTVSETAQTDPAQSYTGLGAGLKSSAWGLVSRVGRGLSSRVPQGLNGLTSKLAPLPDTNESGPVNSVSSWMTRVRSKLPAFAAVTARTSAARSNFGSVWDKTSQSRAWASSMVTSGLDGLRSWAATPSPETRKLRQDKTTANPSWASRLQSRISSFAPVSAKVSAAISSLRSLCEETNKLAHRAFSGAQSYLSNWASRPPARSYASSRLHETSRYVRSNLPANCVPPRWR